MAILERGVNKSTAQVLEPIIQDVYDRLQVDEGIVGGASPVENRL